VKKLSIGEGITTIADRAFYGCTNLEGTLSLPSTLTKIGAQAFKGCENLTGSLVIPDSVTEIGTEAFRGCSGLNGTLTLPANLEILASQAFYKCSGLTGSINLPDSVTNIGSWVFLNCENLTGIVTIPANATVNEDFLYRCSGIKRVVNNSSSAVNLPTDELDFWIDLSNPLYEISSVSAGQTAVRRCKVQFYAQGSVYTEQIVNVGETVVKPADPVLEEGWTLTSIMWHDGKGNEYDFSTPVTKGMTLYANMSYSSTASSPVSGPTTGGSSDDTSYDDDDDDDDTTASTGSTTASAPVSVSVSGTNTASVADTIKDVAAGSTVTVDMSSNKTITTDVLEAAKGKNVDIVLDMGGYTWTINGSQITGDSLHDVNMNVSFGTNNISQNEISSLVGNNSYQTISLDYDGPFGFTASLGFNVGSANAGKYVNLYYYTDEKVMEYQNSGVVDAQGNTTLTFTHASEYVAVIDSAAHTSVTSGTSASAKSPITADAAMTVPFILLMFAAAAVMFGARASKKRHN
jgi:hypothetical protein